MFSFPSNYSIITDLVLKRKQIVYLCRLDKSLYWPGNQGKCVHTCTHTRTHTHTHTQGCWAELPYRCIPCDALCKWSSGTSQPQPPPPCCPVDVNVSNDPSLCIKGSVSWEEPALRPRLSQPPSPAPQPPLSSIKACQAHFLNPRKCALTLWSKKGETNNQGVICGGLVKDSTIPCLVTTSVAVAPVVHPPDREVPTLFKASVSVCGGRQIKRRNRWNRERCFASRLH